MSVMMLERNQMLPYATCKQPLTKRFTTEHKLYCMVTSLELSITTTSQSCMCFWLLMNATTQLAECCTMWLAKLGCCCKLKAALCALHFASTVHIADCVRGG